MAVHCIRSEIPGELFDPFDCLNRLSSHRHERLRLLRDLLPALGSYPSAEGSPAGTSWTFAPPFPPFVRSFSSRCAA
jgi:hypothetical protein